MAVEQLDARAALRVRMNLAGAVHWHSQRHAQALAVSCEGLELTYGQLARQAARLARHLESSRGWGESTPQPPRVGILAARGVPACIGLLGACWAGATYVPLGLKLSEARILQVLAQCRPCALVVDASGARLLSERMLRAVPTVVSVSGDEALPQARATARTPGSSREAPDDALATPPVEMHPLDAAYILFTSGSTGVPKGVVVPVGAVDHYLRAITPLLGLQASDRMLETFEPSFDASVHNLFSAWEAGASLHILPASRVMSAVAFAREQALTVWTSVPSLVGMLRQVKALVADALPQVRLSCFGGEPLTRGVVQAWQAVAPASALWNLYGPTEATVTCLAQRVGDPLPLREGSDVLAIGQPLPGCEVAVLDAHGRRRPEGEVGELAVAGPQLATGYLDDVALTAQRFVTQGGKRWYRTGDLAVRDGAGRMHCLGRVDHQVKVRGHRVELEEVDAHLRQVLDTALVATLAWPLVDGAAQGLVAFVAGQPVDEAATVCALQSRLPPYMVPARILAVEDMPLNASGKVDRQALRQRLQDGGRG